MPRQPIPKQPLAPFIAAAEAVAEEHGTTVTIANFAPFSGYCGTFLAVRFAGGVLLHVETNSTVWAQFGEAEYRLGSHVPDTFVSTPDELRAAADKVLKLYPPTDDASHADYMKRLELNRVDID